MKPILFVLKMPFKDSDGKLWFCTHCALIEGALATNTHWQEHVDIRRIDNRKPRQEVVDLLGVENQCLPVLAFQDKTTIRDPIEITGYMATKYGGAAPHP